MIADMLKLLLGVVCVWWSGQLMWPWDGHVHSVGRSFLCLNVLHLTCSCAYFCHFCLCTITQHNNKEVTVELRYNGLGYNGDSVNTDFFLVPAESLLISVSNTTVRSDSLVRTFVYYGPVFRSQHYGHAGYNRLIEITRCLRNHDSCLTDSRIVRTAIVTSWLHNQHGNQQDQLILGNLLPLANRWSLPGWG